MANIVVGEETYTFNYEWIAASSGIGEEICGVDKDCIVVPSSPLSLKIEPMGQPEDSDEFVTEIQVTEEEVVADTWNTQSHGSVYLFTFLCILICAMKNAYCHCFLHSSN